MSELKRELEDLIAHPGWKWFEQRVDAEWGPRGDRFMPELKKALNDSNNDFAASQARQILSGQAVILALLRAPHEELAKLRNKELAQNADQRARVPLTPELASQSRRGGL